MFYKTCPHCGANLDPGEQCDCLHEKTVVDRLRDDYKPSSKPTKEEAIWMALGLVRN
jgi:hypothetical protein